MEITQSLLDPYVLLYLALVTTAVGVRSWVKRQHATAVQDRRRAQGLPPDVLVSQSVRLPELRREAWIDAVFFLSVLVVTPFALALVAHTTGRPEGVQGIATTFLVLLVWTLFSGTDVAKALLGGLAFKTLVAFQSPFQVGDRVSLGGHGGRVVNIGVFFVTLKTADGDLVSVPTAGLWGQPIVSLNAGERSSLAVMTFHVSPAATADQLQSAENTIWDSMQASTYLEPSRPMQIFLSQSTDSIDLSAKAYVASTYDQALFESDVTRAFLDHALSTGIPLASPG